MDTTTREYAPSRSNAPDAAHEVADSCREACAFSVIVPTRNRPTQLRSCLEALRRVTRPAGGLEVIVVDDGGSMPLDPIVQCFESSFRIRLLTSEHRGPGAARNLGASVACGRYLVFTDDDCCPYPEWLIAFADEFNRAPEALLGGTVVNGLTRNAFSAASQMVVDLFSECYNADEKNASLFTSNNMAVPLDQFRRYGGFDEALCIASEDRDLCDRWLAAGGTMIKAGNAAVAHFHELNLTGFCRQHFRYGRGAGMYYQRRPRNKRQNLAASARFHFALPRLVALRLAQASISQALPLLVLLALWLACNSAGFAYETARCGLASVK